MDNSQKWIELYKLNQINWDDTRREEMTELELLLTQSDVDYIESVCGEFCFC